MKFNKNEFGWKEKVSVNTNLNNNIFNIKFLPDMNISSKIYAVNAVNLEEKTIYKINTNINKKYLAIRYIFSDGTFKNLYNLSSMYLSGKVEIYISRKTDTLIEFDVDYIRYTCNIDEVNKTVEITKKALILNTDNAQEYTPTKDYHPATKKYVDETFTKNNKWGQISGDIADQQDLQNEFTKKQDKTTAWNTTNLVVGTQQPEIPENGYIIWIDTNS